jgi:ribosome-binding protein aMBF1 (putative translation factor)
MTANSRTEEQPLDEGPIIMSTKIQNPEPIVQALAQHLRHLRKEKGWSQKDMAAAAGMNASYLGQIERAEIAIRLGTAARIAKGLNMTLSDLLKSRRKHH